MNLYSVTKLDQKCNSKKLYITSIVELAKGDIFDAKVCKLRIVELSYRAQ